MKALPRIVACLTASLLAGVVGAQHIETLVRGDDDWSFFVQPEFKATRISDQSAQMAGIRLGPALDRVLHIGLAGHALVSSVEPGDMTTYKDINAFDLWYAGLSADYTFMPRKLLHGSIGCLLGAGQLRARHQISGSDIANLFVAEPQANLMFNLTDTLELGCGLSYRWVNGSDLSGLSNTDLSGLAGSVFLRWTEDP